MAYLNGERCFNDEHAVAAFQEGRSCALRAGRSGGTRYYDSQQIFLMGEVGMWLGGSWTSPSVERPLGVGVFAVPAPEGQEES
jgi:ABC-type glycerol-3-phosphate transport system substrate-binding protein